MEVNKTFKVKKSFGLDVLLKLTKATIKDIEIFENDSNYSFNISVEELSRAVDITLLHHNISLSVN